MSSALVNAGSMRPMAAPPDEHATDAGGCQCAKKRRRANCRRLVKLVGRKRRAPMLLPCPSRRQGKVLCRQAAASSWAGW
jgi:hypothetical protein